MAFTSAQLASLEKSASTGQLLVQLGPNQVRYQTYDHLLMALRLARQDVAASQAAPGTETGGLRFWVCNFPGG